MPLPHLPRGLRHVVRGSVPLELNWECHRLLNWFQFHCTVLLASVGPGLSSLPPMQPGPFLVWDWGLSWVFHSHWRYRRELSRSAGSGNSFSFPQSLVQSRKAGITSALASSTLNNEELVGAGAGWVGGGWEWESEPWGPGQQWRCRVYAPPASSGEAWACGMLMAASGDRIMGSLGLERTYKIIKSSCQPSTITIKPMSSSASSALLQRFSPSLSSLHRKTMFTRRPCKP